MTHPNPGQEARAEIHAQAMFTRVEGEMLDEDPGRYAADVAGFNLLESTLRAWKLNRDMLLARRVSTEFYPEGVSDRSRADYALARVQLRGAVQDLARRWASEDEEDSEND